MTRLFPNKESGVSIVELTIAAGLLSFIALGASQFFKRMGTAEYEARAKASSAQEVSLFAAAMERDFKLRDITAASTTGPLCAGGLCKTFSIDSKVKSGTGEATLTITYSNSCRPVPGSHAPKIGKLAFDRPFNPDQPFNQGRCFQSIGCKAGTFPQVSVRMAGPAGAKLPVYPRLNGNQALLPDPNDKTSASSSIIGAAVCAESKMGSGSNGSDRVSLEVAFLNSEGDFRIEKKDVSIPRSNVAKIQMLPGN